MAACSQPELVPLPPRILHAVRAWVDQEPDVDWQAAGGARCLRVLAGKFHDQGDTEWIVIRGQLRGHNDTPFGRPTPGRPFGQPEVNRPQGVMGGFSDYELVMIFGFLC